MVQSNRLISFSVWGKMPFMFVRAVKDICNELCELNPSGHGFMAMLYGNKVYC